MTLSAKSVAPKWFYISTQILHWTSSGDPTLWLAQVMFIASEPIFSAVWVVFSLTLHRFFLRFLRMRVCHTKWPLPIFAISLKAQINLHKNITEFDRKHHLSCHSFCHCAHGQITVTKYI